MAYVELDCIDFSEAKMAEQKFDVKITRKSFDGPNGYAIMRIKGQFNNVSKFCKEWYGDDLDEYIKGK